MPRRKLTYVEVLQPEEEGPVVAWVGVEGCPSREAALREAKREVWPWPADARVEEEPVLMRTESDVEAAIRGHEFPYWVPCTSRARSPERFWRIVSDR